MRMKVCEIGFPRTGTRSLSAAMQILGFSSQHGVRGLDQDTKKNIARKLLFGSTNLSIYNQFDFVGDLPRVHWQQLHDEYEHLKFILTIREDDEWWESCKRRWWNTRRQKARDYARDGVPPDQIVNLINALSGCGTVGLNERIWRENYRSHNRRVIWSTKASRLLIFNPTAGDGWSRLCNFLEVDEPAVPFPHLPLKAAKSK